MEQDKATFEKLIQQDRATRDVREWRGTLLDYLEKIRQEVGLTKLAHARMHDVIVKVGVRDISDTADARAKRLFKDESVKVYSFFADEFFGIEKVVAQIARIRGTLTRQLIERQRFLQEMRALLEESAPVFLELRQKRDYTGDTYPGGIGKLNEILQIYKGPVDILAQAITALRTKYSIKDAELGT